MEALDFKTAITIARILGQRVDEIRQQLAALYPGDVRERQKLEQRYAEACDLVERVYQAVGSAGVEDKGYGDPTFPTFPDEL